MSADLPRTVDRLLADDRAARHPPLGVAIGVRSGDDTHVAAGGLRAPEGDPVTRATAHDLASVTKVLATTTSLMRLVSADAIALDDRVSRHVPAFSGGAKDAVSVRDLLLHRGGLAPWHPLYLEAHDRDHALALAAALPLTAAPGTVRIYSDLGFMLLGWIVERATGLGLADAVSELVTGPLGLSATRFAHPAGTDVAASGIGDSVEMRMIETGIPYPVPFSIGDYTHWRRELLVGEANDGNAFHALGGVSGHAGLFSTIDDLLAFGGALSRYAEYEQLWSPDVARAFFAEGPDAGQALGFRQRNVDVSGGVTVLEHPGFVGCAVGFIPDRGVAVALCSNRLLGDPERDPQPTEELWRPTLDAALASLTDPDGAR